MVERTPTMEEFGKNNIKFCSTPRRYESQLYGFQHKLHSTLHLWERANYEHPRGIRDIQGIQAPFKQCLE